MNYLKLKELRKRIKPIMVCIIIDTYGYALYCSYSLIIQTWVFLRIAVVIMFHFAFIPTGAGYSGIVNRPGHLKKRDQCMEILADFFGDLPLTCCHYMIKNPLA